MIGQIREISGKPVGFKSVFGSYDWLEEMCLEINVRGIESAPDFITVDSGDGGTGAAPMPLMDNVGLPVRESLPMVSDVLHKYGLRERIRTIASGKLVNPSEVAWAIATGADFVTSARGFMFALGCIQSLKCNKNTCPTGVTTHNPRLQKGLNPADKSVKVANYCKKLIQEVQDHFAFVWGRKAAFDEQGTRSNCSKRWKIYSDEFALSTPCCFSEYTAVDSDRSI